MIITHSHYRELDLKIESRITLEINFLRINLKGFKEIDIWKPYFVMEQIQSI